jgi:hypothetical protein
MEKMNILKIFFKIFEWFHNIFKSCFFFLEMLTKTTEQYKINKPDGENEQEKNIRERIIDDKLFNKKDGILNDDLNEFVNALGKTRIFGEPDKSDDYLSPEQRESINETLRSEDPLKAKGDSYEKLIGKMFEAKGDLVIYYGFIKGYEDRGVDLIIISSKTKTVNLVQCKNWEQRSFKLEDIEKVYSKLNDYRPDFRILKPDDINFYLDNPKDKKTIFTLLEYGISYKFRKTLYISSDKVVDLATGRHLTMMAPNIFKYKEMKMVVKGMN